MQCLYSMGMWVARTGLLKGPRGLSDIVYVVLTVPLSTPHCLTTTGLFVDENNEKINILSVSYVFSSMCLLFKVALVIHLGLM